MTLQQLKYFCSVTEYGSFTKAADQERITQPSLSLQIRRLERSVGAQLFIRLARSVRLTPAGEILYSHAKNIISLTKRAKSSVSQLQDSVRGPLRIGAIPTVLPYLLGPRLQAFSELCPDVETMLTEDVTTNLINKLRSGDLDIAIVSLPLRQPDIVSNELLRESLFLVAPRGHTLCRTHISQFDLSREKIILLKEGHCFRDNMLLACRRSSGEMAPTFESDHFGSIFPLVAAGMGVTIAPRMAVMQAHDCSILPLPRQQSRRIGYACLRSSGRFKTVIAFTKWLRTVTHSLTTSAESQ